jgi:hypothetical protein
MGLFQRLRSAPKAERAFNDALDINRSLQRYPERSPQYRQQLRQIVSLCQEAIALNERHGDGHVLLANAYFLMYIDGFPDTGNPLPLHLASAVIQHWADEPMRQYPWTKNTENGNTIHSMVADALLASRTGLTQDHQHEMRRLKAASYIAAISRDNFR